MTATHDIEWTTQAQNTVLTNLSGNVANGEISFTSSLTEGSLSADVINNSGSVLPSTGGMGTTIFYVVGSVLVVGAGVLLISKKRMNG